MAIQHQVKIRKGRQISVPADVLRELSIEIGDSVEIEVQDGAILLIPLSTDPVGELRGLGREIWTSEDPQEYVNRERDEW